MSITLTLKQAIRSALETLGISDADFALEHPTDLSHGDFACNVAMVYAKQVGKNPKVLAEEVVAELQGPSSPLLAGEGSGVRFVSKIEIAGPGFINITLAKSYFAELNKEITLSMTVERVGSAGTGVRMFGMSDIHAGKKILIEHSSPNLFKPFHIGHMMNNAIGESLVRLMKFSGADVSTMSFPSDISLGVAKAIYIILGKYGHVDDALMRTIDQNFDLPSIISIDLLGKAYIEGTKQYDDDTSVHIRVKEIADNLYGNIASPELDIFNACKKFNIEYFETIVGKLGSHFDSYIYESEAGIVGKELVMKNTPGIFTESEGAIVYIPEESKKSLNTAVFINSQGNPTYEAKDIGLLDLKFERIHPDLSLFVTDHEQIPHFKIVLDAAEKINKSWTEKSIHISHGRMSFKGQKMSSRLGGVPLATDIIDMVLTEVSERGEGRPIANDGEIAEAVAIGAIKFAILRAKPGQNINFDPETSLSFEGDSGPYLQYTHARISSVIEKAAEVDLHLAYSEAESPTDLERIQLQFETVVANAIVEYAPQHIVTYLLELSRAFNAFYATNKIVDPENKTISEHRLAIARATQIILKNGLWLLGIQAPDHM